jgi:hypothetical protein
MKTIGSKVLAVQQLSFSAEMTISAVALSPIEKPVTARQFEQLFYLFRGHQRQASSNRNCRCECVDIYRKRRMIYQSKILVLPFIPMLYSECTLNQNLMCS